jgi:hypothetical protein
MEVIKKVYTKEELIQKIVEVQQSQQDGLWVRLESTIKICLIAYSEDQQVFVGKFFPCAKNSRTYSIHLEDVDEILEDSANI